MKQEYHDVTIDFWADYAFIWFCLPMLMLTFESHSTEYCLET